MKNKKVGMDRGGMLKVPFWEIGFESLCKKGNHLGDEPHVLEPAAHGMGAPQAE